MARWRRTAASCPASASGNWPVRSTLVQRHEIALDRPAVQLARTTDLLLRVADHLVPLRHPAYRACQREDHREHIGRDADRPEHDARIEIHVRVELAFDEVRIAQCSLL